MIDYKTALKESAMKRKPKGPNVIATEKGWVRPQASGYMELLVSIKGLDAILGDSDEVEVVTPSKTEQTQPVDSESALEPVVDVPVELEPVDETVVVEPVAETVVDVPVVDNTSANEDVVEPVVEVIKEETPKKKKPGRKKKETA